MWLALDTENGVTLSRQIYQGIRNRILTGALAEGERLPSSRDLAAGLGVSRGTVLEAYDQLIAEGYLEGRRGSGTVVAEGIAPEAGFPGKTVMAGEKALSGPVPGETGGRMRSVEASPGEQRCSVISFRSGIPALEAFPVREWGRLYRRECEIISPSALRYSQPDGITELREALAAYLRRSRGMEVSPSRLMITSGATQGLAVLAGLLHNRGPDALVEDPVHRGLVEVARRAGYRIRSLPVDGQGMDTSLLDTFAEREAEGVAFAYVTPSHQYPMGSILPVRRRQELVRFARDNGCLIVEDDYDGEFRHEGRPVSSIYELAPDCVAYLGSFSKLLAPALRLGYAIVPEHLVGAWTPGKRYTDVHTDALSQRTLAAFIESGGFEAHVWKMKKLYKRKREHLLRLLVQRFGETFTILGHATGLHLVAAFPGVTFDEAVVGDLARRGVEAVPVERYSLRRDGTHAHEIILGYSHLSLEDMARGVAILGDVLDGARAR